LKKILFKRKIAAFIDYLILGTMLTVCGFSDMPEWFWGIRFRVGALPVSLPSIGFFAVLFLIALKDFLFRNASLGKKIMGLCILDENGTVPNVKIMLKRGFFMQTAGYVTYLRYCFSDGDIVEWELQHLKTQVVSQKSTKNSI